jgi:hypothetical protein
MVDDKILYMGIFAFIFTILLRKFTILSINLKIKVLRLLKRK